MYDGLLINQQDCKQISKLPCHAKVRSQQFQILTVLSCHNIGKATYSNLAFYILLSILSINTIVFGTSGSAMCTYITPSNL